MNNVTSLSEIITDFKLKNIEISNEEIVTLNTIFSEADKYDEENKFCKNGDGELNTSEYYVFTKLLKNFKDFFEKFKQTLTFQCREPSNKLSLLYLEDELDEEFCNNLSSEEINELFDNISFTDDSYKLNKTKIEYLFKLKFRNVEAEDLKALFSDFMSKYDDNSDDKLQKCEVLNSLKYHINKRISAQNSKTDRHQEVIEPNGKIDADFYQGYTGDCWFLSSVKALASSKNGLKRLNEMISVQKSNGEIVSVTVHLQGKDYVISKGELYSAVEYSTGDLDVRALEIAANRFCIENGYKDITDGGHDAFGYSILTGDAEMVKRYGAMRPEDFTLKKNDIDKLKSKNCTGCLGGAFNGKYAIDVETGEKVPLILSHAYALIGSDKNYVYLSNPLNSSRKLKIKIDSLFETFTGGFLFEI